jgi:hypothetical protein
MVRLTSTKVSRTVCSLHLLLMPHVVLKQIHTDTGISNKAILNLFVNDIFERIASEASSVYSLFPAVGWPDFRQEPASYSKKSTISWHEIQHMAHSARRTFQARHL